MAEEYGCWWIDPKTGQKVPGTNPRTEKKPTTKKKPAKAPKGKE